MPAFSSWVSTFVSTSMALNVICELPLFQLIDGYPEATLAHEKTDVFRTQVEYAEGIKDRLRAARRQGRDQIYQIEVELGSLTNEEAGVIVDLFMSYRAVKAWVDMIRMFEKIDKALKNTILIREQYALALNRAEQDQEAEEVLTQLIEHRGPSSETYGLLGGYTKIAGLRLRTPAPILPPDC